jgi:hypothetical protein
MRDPHHPSSSFASILDIGYQEVRPNLFQPQTHTWDFYLLQDIAKYLKTEKLPHSKFPFQKQKGTFSFLGLTQYFRIWIPNDSIVSKPLYKAAKGDLDEPLPRPQILKTRFNLLKQALSRAPALSIPNPNEIIRLYLYSDKGQALGLVAQSAGDSVAPAAYLSKQLGPIYSGWPACLKVPATATLLIPEAQKITFNLPMTVWSSRNIQDLISHRALNSFPLPCLNLTLFSLTTQPNFSMMLEAKPCYPQTPHPTQNL